MSPNHRNELTKFLSTYIAETDLDSEDPVIQKFLIDSPLDTRTAIATQLKALIASDTLMLEDLGSDANRWFASLDEAREWLGKLSQAFTGSASGGVVVKDSNGAILLEGDSVQVIKDLKVKGGSSDLKRGTLIKKIHLIDDPDNVECRVDGSTLVLKTCFLKKS
jgi:protein PhnA